MAEASIPRPPAAVVAAVAGTGDPPHSGLHQRVAHPEPLIEAACSAPGDGPAPDPFGRRGWSGVLTVGGPSEAEPAGIDALELLDLGPLGTAAGRDVLGDLQLEAGRLDHLVHAHAGCTDATRMVGTASPPSEPGDEVEHAQVGHDPADLVEP